LTPVPPPLQRPPARTLVLIFIGISCGEVARSAHRARRRIDDAKALHYSALGVPQRPPPARTLVLIFIGISCVKGMIQHAARAEYSLLFVIDVR
jgi:hypothetical protein